MHRIAWIACFAILLAALAPTISHALAAQQHPVQQQEWVEICSMEGSKMVMVEHEHTAPQPAHDSFGHMEHCPFCLNHAVAHGLPPIDSPVLPMVAGSSVLPPLYYQASRPLFAWDVAQPRAPPFFS